MALIKCPECGKEISDKSKACIHCGYPLQPETTEQIDTPSMEVGDDTFEKTADSFENTESAEETTASAEYNNKPALEKEKNPEMAVQQQPMHTQGTENAENEKTRSKGLLIVFSIIFIIVFVFIAYIITGRIYTEYGTSAEFKQESEKLFKNSYSANTIEKDGYSVYSIMLTNNTQVIWKAISVKVSLNKGDIQSVCVIKNWVPNTKRKAEFKFPTKTIESLGDDLHLSFTYSYGETEESDKYVSYIVSNEKIDTGAGAFIRNLLPDRISAIVVIALLFILIYIIIVLVFLHVSKKEERDSELYIKQEQERTERKKNQEELDSLRKKAREIVEHASGIKAEVTGDGFDADYNYIVSINQEMIRFVKVNKGILTNQSAEYLKRIINDKTIEINASDYCHEELQKDLSIKKSDRFTGEIICEITPLTIFLVNDKDNKKTITIIIKELNQDFYPLLDLFGIKVKNFYDIIEIPDDNFIEWVIEGNGYLDDVDYWSSII